MNHTAYLALCIKANSGEESACNWHSPCQVSVRTDVPNKIALSEPSGYSAARKNKGERFFSARCLPCPATQVKSSY